MRKKEKKRKKKRKKGIRKIRRNSTPCTERCMVTPEGVLAEIILCALNCSVACLTF
jgi:hypothetical protein